MIIKDFETKAQAERYAVRYSAKANVQMEVITMGGTWYVKYPGE